MNKIIWTLCIGWHSFLIYIFLSINYTDQPYYRYQYDEEILKIELCETIDATIETMKKAFDDFRKAENDKAA